MNLPSEILMHIFQMIPFTNMVKNILVSKQFQNIIKCMTWQVGIYYIGTNGDYKIALKFKLIIDKLVIGPGFKCRNVNLTNINYKKLIFNNVDFMNVASLLDIDSEISHKCQGIQLIKCINYSVSLIRSFDILQECKYIWICGKLCTDENNLEYTIINNKEMYLIGISYLLLKKLKSLPKLCDIYLSDWKLYNHHLNFLNCYDNISLYRVQIFGNSYLLRNNYRVHITNSYDCRGQIEEIIMNGFKINPK